MPPTSCLHPFWAFCGVFSVCLSKPPQGVNDSTCSPALHAIRHELFTVKNLTYITAETVCELLRLLAGSYPGIPITVVLDNARYQRCALVQTLAERLGIELRYLPTYSPNLNLIERLWKFVKKQCLYSKYYPDSESFQQAIMKCLEQAPTKHKATLDTLLTLRFQTCKEVPVVGEKPEVCLFPVSKQSEKEVSPMAA